MSTCVCLNLLTKQLIHSNFELPARAARAITTSLTVLVLSLSTSPKRRIKMAATTMARKPMTRKAEVAWANSTLNTQTNKIYVTSAPLR